MIFGRAIRRIFARTARGLRAPSLHLFARFPFCAHCLLKCKGTRRLRLDPLDESGFPIICRFTYEKTRNDHLKIAKANQCGAQKVWQRLRVSRRWGIFCTAKANNVVDNCSRKLSRALKSGGTIAIAEWLVNDDRTKPLPSLMFSVQMLVNTEKGGTFSFNEIKKWLEDAGFKKVRKLEAPGPSPLILATKP